MNHFEPDSTPDEGTGVLYLFHLIDKAVPSFFAPDREITVARAPGILDVMGAVAGRDGRLSLQLPLAEAACIAVQSRDDDQLHVWSPGRDDERAQLVSIRLADLGLGDAPANGGAGPLDYDAARALFAAAERSRWAAHVFGGLLALAREHGVRPSRGVAVLLRSDVPSERGLGASAAIQVAALRALAELHGLALPGAELARLAGLVDRAILGARGGAGAPWTAACAEQDEVLALDGDGGAPPRGAALPEGLELIGIDSGVRAATAQAAADVRIAAAIGARLQTAAGVAADTLPETMTGAEFAQRFPADAAQLGVVAGQDYAVRAAARHVAGEHERAQRFLELLQSAPADDTPAQLGELMFASHRSSSSCGLGHEVTDFLIEQVQARRAQGARIHGARVTGCARGGTVAILGDRTAAWHEALRVKKALLQRTGHSAEIQRYSSPGAMAFGALRLRPKG
ncbi:MAG: hypothetical protein AB7O97_07590 [Planctomycetota bacterium]